jgi:diguanylate cyclase (GGDEF)-like protein
MVRCLLPLASVNIDDVLKAVEQALSPGRLGPIERLVIHQSWIGRTYSEMAQGTGYGSDYIKEVGSELWQELSQVLGRRVTKKNLHLVFSQPKQGSFDYPKIELQSTLHASSASQTALGIDLFPTGTIAKLEFPDAPVPLGSPLYIHRPSIEQQSLDEIRQPGSVTRIKAPKRMGKTSLLSRIITHAKADGFKTIYLNFQEADKTVFESLDLFLRWFLANCSKQLNFRLKLDDYWDKDIGSKVSCKAYFEEYLLENLDCPLLLALDEIHCIFEHPAIAQDFLSMLRSWHEQARQVETWQKFRLVVAYATENCIPLKLSQSPFNVGLSITLPPFTLEQVQDLAQRYGLGWTTREPGNRNEHRNESNNGDHGRSNNGDHGRGGNGDNSGGSSETDRLTRLVEMLGGHPYLVNMALYHLCKGELTLEELLQNAPTQSGIYSHYLRSQLIMLRSEPRLEDAMRQVVMAEESVQIDAIVAYELESVGLIKLQENQAQPSCELYRRYFREHLHNHQTATALTSPNPSLNSSLNGGKSRLQDLNYLDPVTQLANQLYFNQQLEIKWQHSLLEEHCLSVIVCDLDYFKYFNESYGQQTGDTYLQLIAKTIQDCVEQQDRLGVEQQDTLVARYGGTKFALLLPQTDADAAFTIAETLRQSIQAQAIPHDQSKFGGFPEPVLTASVGVASTTPRLHTPYKTIVGAAEDALEQSKRRGYNCTTLSHCESLLSRDQR